MRQAIAGVPPQMQAVYRRHLFEGVHYAAVAAELGIEVSEVERLIAQSIVLIDANFGCSVRKRRQVDNPAAVQRATGVANVRLHDGIPARTIRRIAKPQALSIL